MSKRQGENGPHVLVVIDHAEARVFRTEVRGAVPERIHPYDPHGYGRHLHSTKEWAEGARPSERRKFHEAVAHTLIDAGQILVFGHGKGRSSEMDLLLADLKEHHVDVWRKVIGTAVVDPHRATENELLAKAREIYAEYNQNN